MTTYEISPMDGRASFYGKARVFCDDNGTETLFSYETAVMQKESDGTLIRLWDGWSYTTGRHIWSFCALRKKELDKMETGKRYKRSDLT